MAMKELVVYQELSVIGSVDHGGGGGGVPTNQRIASLERPPGDAGKDLGASILK